MRSAILIVSLALACLFAAQSNAGTLKGDKIGLPMEDYYQAIRPGTPSQPRIARLVI
jgi:hypothetical protein